jgi:putative acetyltransferase
VTEMSAFEIREEEPGDEAAIHAVEALAFGQPLEAEIVDRVRVACPEHVSLVALLDSRIVGHILFTPVTIEAPEPADQRPRGYGLGPMAVHLDHQGKGIGSALVRAGLARMREMGTPFVVVLGHPRYYPRFGFAPASRLSLRPQWEVPDEVFMIHVFAPSRELDLSGTARYRPEFDDAG